MTRIDGIVEMFLKTLPYFGVFVGSLILSLILTPLVRKINSRLGMVDVPGGRRINKRPVARGGGVAVIASFVLSMSALAFFVDGPVSTAFHDSIFWRMIALSLGIGALGFIDDKFGMKPVVKLIGQISVASMVYFWCHISFRLILPMLPWWVDLLLTVFWIVGAVNAFNLIDGLDGLASGLAVIAAMGMAGTLFFLESPRQMFLYLAFVGSLLGFLRYNFNPASIFLGDTGSMFLGFFLSTMPLATNTSGSFLVGIGVPMLAMGVPIFDTALAIMRRTVRVLMKRESGSSSDGTKIMQPDSDHIHHRLLRRLASQRKTAMVMYAFATFLVIVGAGCVMLEDRAAGLFLVAFVVVTFIVVKDISRVELVDAGRLANIVAHNLTPVRRRRRAALSVPLLIFADILILSVTWYLTLVVFKIEPTARSFHTFLPLRVIPVFLALVFFGGYSVVWGRAMLSNYIRLIVSVMAGMSASMVIMLMLGYVEARMVAFPVVHFGLSVILLMSVRTMRQIVRDLSYLVQVKRMADEMSFSRTLVFGAGLRFRAFRREIVRKIMTERRVIVGIVDDDILLRGKYIGGIKVDGPHMDAKRIVKETKADSLVIACELAPERLHTVVESFKSCGLKISHFTFEETEL